MFEEEVDEMAVNNAKKKYGLEGSICMNIQECAYVNGFQQGAKFGYNKANEWHKPSEKLPEECSLVLAYSFDDTEPSLWKFVTSDQWEWLPKRIVFCSNDQIRLWKEIVLPELPKESE